MTVSAMTAIAASELFTKKAGSLWFQKSQNTL